jgi:ribosomal protein S18 acetylase RimI-like enzyme
VKKLFLIALLFCASPIFAAENVEIFVDGDKDGGIIELYLKGGDRDELAGFLKYGDCEISKLTTYPEYRGRGFAKMMMNEALAQMEDCVEISLFASPLDDETNLSDLTKFYGKFGFKKQKKSILDVDYGVSMVRKPYYYY